MLVTTTSTAPTVCAGVKQVIEVAETTTTEVALAPPNVTVAPDKNPVPVIVVAVPPVVTPDETEREVTVGAGFT